MNIYKKILTIAVALVITYEGYAQQTSSPYQLSVKREMVYGGAAMTASLTGFFMHQQVEPVALGEISLPKISGIDKIAPQVLNITPSDVSDVLLFSSIALPSLFLTGERSRKDWKTIGILYAEAMFLNVGLTDIVKTLSLRPRPYTLNEDLPPTTILERNDRSSFFSGHTSVTATASFFCARTFADYYPNSKLKPYVWTTAAVLPALMGYLRVRAGKHYPSDVFTGYLIGGAIGYLLPILHKKPVRGPRLTISPAFGGAIMVYQF